MRQIAPTPTQARQVHRTRRYELDWLRTVVVFGLIPVHTAAIFTPMADLYLKDTQTSASMILVGTFLGAFGMPVLFFVSGAASWFALGSRTKKQYVTERVTRLLVPLIFATLVIIPIQVYVVTLSNPSLATAIGAPIRDPDFLSSYPRFYVQYLWSYLYFTGHPSVGGFIAFIGQLWFVLYLLVFSLIALPVFSYLRRPGCQRQIARLAAFASRPGVIFTLALPLALVDRLAHMFATGAVAEILVYLLCFVYGYVLYADERFVQAMRQQWVAAVIAGCGLWIVADIFLLQGVVMPYDNSMGSVFFVPLRGIIAWFWVVGLVGFASTYLNKTSHALRYLSDAAYPVYVLHVAVIVSVGYFVITWSIPLLAKYVLIMALALVILLGCYDLLIRRRRALRILFGLHPARREDGLAPQPTEAPAVHRRHVAS